MPERHGEIRMLFNMLRYYLSMRAAASICSFQIPNKINKIKTSSVGATASKPDVK